MNDDSLLLQLLAAEAGPDQSQDNAHEENHDRAGGVGDGGGKSNSGCGNKGGAIGVFLGATDNSVSKHGAEKFAVVTLPYIMKTMVPFGDRVDDGEAGKAFSKEKNSGDGNKISISGVGFDKDKVTDYGN